MFVPLRDMLYFQPSDRFFDFLYPNYSRVRQKTGQRAKKSSITPTWGCAGWMTGEIIWVLIERVWSWLILLPNADRKCQFFPLVFYLGGLWSKGGKGGQGGRDGQGDQGGQGWSRGQVDQDGRLGRVADLDALLLEIGCGQKDPQRGEAGNPQFHIFRCTSISWIHVGESVTQSLNHSCFWDFWHISWPCFRQFWEHFWHIWGKTWEYFWNTISIFWA